jgi:hypothetical protein
MRSDGDWFSLGSKTDGSHFNGNVTAFMQFNAVDTTAIELQLK